MKTYQQADTKKYFWALYLLIPLFLAWIFFFKMISPGYVGIVVNLFGEEKGAEAKELTVGMHWIAPWKTVYEFPVFEQNYTWEGSESFLFQTGEGLNVSAQIGISYHLRQDQIHKLFCRYRRGIEEITDLFLKNYIRDAIAQTACHLTVEDLYGSEKEVFMKNVQSTIKVDLEDIGIEIDRIYLIGRLGFPDTVVAALNSKIEATQRAQQRENELREADAQAKKEIAKANGEASARFIRAQAEADSNRLVASSLCPAIISYEAIKKWDGKLPKVLADSLLPMIDIDMED